MQAFETESKYAGPTPMLAKLSRGLSFRRSVSQLKDTDGVNQALEAAKKPTGFFASIPAVSVAALLHTDVKAGLTKADAEYRLRVHGPNELAKDPPTPLWKMLLEQFSDLLVLMLIVASIISIALGHYAAGVVIIIIVIANAVLGVVQESRAGAALSALSSLSEPKTEVIRDGQRVMVDSNHIVPGDLVVLENGRSVSADIRLIETQGLQCNEAALTGEPDASKKDGNWIDVNYKEPVATPVRPDGEVLEEKMELEDGKKKEKALTEKNVAYRGCHVEDGRGIVSACATREHMVWYS